MDSQYNIKIISNQQTPSVPEILDVNSFINENFNKLKEFQNFVEIDGSCITAVGLAANQVSIDDERSDLRTFAIKNIRDNGEFERCRFSLIINPVIEEYIGIKELKCEGCLTWPNKIIVAERSKAIKVSFYDIFGNKHDETYNGFYAQIFQHEVNHLNGINERIEEHNFKIKPLHIERNDKCPCNSGKKYKQCCLKYEKY